MQKPDGLIFDLDGTLWDASKTYADSWNATLAAFNIDRRVSPEEVGALAGLESRKVVEHILPDLSDEERAEFYDEMMVLRRNLINREGGVLYEGVKEGLERLAKRYPVFILSNCGKGIIPAFIKWAGIEAFVTDELSNGDTNLPKDKNIAKMVYKHNLRQAAYIGDTDGDAEKTRMAGISFIYVSYGFGATTNYDLMFDSFTGLVNHFMEL